MNRSEYYGQKKKRPSKAVIASLVIILVLGVLIAFNYPRIQLMFKGYGFSEQGIILELDNQEIKRYLDEDKIDNLVSWDEMENDHHYIEYTNYQNNFKNLSKQEVVKYIDTFYQDYYEALTKLGYSYNNIMALMESATLDDFKLLVDNQYSYKKISPYLNIKGMLFSDLPEYLKSNQEPLQTVLSVSYPMIDASKKSNRVYEIIEPDNILLLIKKGFVLPDDYEPSDLTVPNIPIAPDNSHNKLRKAASKALESMYQDALKGDYHLVLNSGYRSFKEQQEIYDEYFKRYDEITASGLVAVPGSSEHQLGLGVDLTSQSVIDKERMVFGDTKEYRWIVQNAYKYGFILRYPKDRSNITGTANEPWHLRYVGKDVAKVIYDNNWTLEEYVLNNGLSYDLKLK